MLALFWIIAGAFALMLIVPILLFAYLSLEPHVAQRSLRTAQVSKPETSNAPLGGTAASI